MFIPTLCVLVCGLLTSSDALDNGLARTPPMGWLSWLRFGCTTDCVAKPAECISENLIKRTVDAMASQGFVDAGYKYVVIDSCWSERERDSSGRLVPSRTRFPSGFKALSRYVQSKGLKFGIYENHGKKTCDGYPGVLGHEATDAATFAEWEVEYLKLDGCGSPDLENGYPMFGKHLNATGRPMVYSCSWPAYETNPNYKKIAKTCNMWRNTANVANSWNSVVGLITWYGEHQDEFAHVAGPGNFNDPDMLVVGNSGLTVDQARVQMAIWSVMAAPLMMSVDLSTIKPEFKEILLNDNVIAVNQDELGKQGLRVWKGVDNVQIWHRELFDGSRALAFVNLRELPADMSFTYGQMKLPQQDYLIQDIYSEESDRSLRAGEDFKVKINSTGVKFYIFIPNEFASGSLSGKVQ